LHDASSDPSTIEKGWAKSPAPNIGLRTGAEAGFFAVDVEAGDGAAAFDGLVERFGPLPTTPTVETGGGGRHFYFAWPDGAPIKSNSRLADLPIDVRGDGGYVVAPPSSHKSGTEYRWLTPLGEQPLAAAPPWLLDFVRSGKVPAQPAPASAARRVFTITAPVDLATEPGVPEGSRHRRALELVGAHLGRGEDAVHVENLALEWGRRCMPPMHDEEVRRIVADLTKKHQEQVESYVNSVSEPPLPELPAWPVLASEALQGLAGDIVRTLEPETEADPVALLIHLLIAFGSLIGRKASYRVEGDRHYSNLFGVVVGRTATARKGTSWGRVRQIAELADPIWADKRVQAGLSSGEGLIYAVRDEIQKTEPIKEKGKITGYQQVVADPGEKDKRLFVVEREFASVLRIARRNGNTLSTTVRQAWDTGNLRTLTRNNPTRATGAHISIVGHITRDELLKHLTETEMANGFANRFLWICACRSKLLPDGGMPIDLTPVAERISNAVRFARNVGEMQRDPDAAALWHEAYASLSEGRPGLLGCIVSRAEAQVLRLSCIYALLDQSNIIRVAHLRAALALWKYAEDSAAYLFGTSVGDPEADKILQALRRAPDGLTRTELHELLSRHCSADALASSLANLRELGVVESRLILTAGRPAERWYSRRRTGEKGEKGDQQAAGTSPQAHPERDDEGVHSDNSLTAQPAEANPSAPTTVEGTDSAKAADGTEVTPSGDTEEVVV
jgi:hypothetical protein